MVPGGFFIDGVADASQGSLSNTFRIYSCVREGWIDSQNVHQVSSTPTSVSQELSTDVVDQKKRYWPGPGTESGKLVKTAAGILGLGCDEIIKEVYQVSRGSLSVSDTDANYSCSTAAKKLSKNMMRSISLASVAEHVSISEHSSMPFINELVRHCQGGSRSVAQHASDQNRKREFRCRLQAGTRALSHAMRRERDI